MSNKPISPSDKESILLFGSRRPSVYPKEIIYDPDRDGEWHPNSGKIIPQLKSIAVSLIGVDVFKLEVVSAIHPKTHKATFSPVGTVSSGEEIEQTRILSYGNDRWYLRYDDRLEATKIMVDSALPILGVENSYYKLIRVLESEEREIISAYIDSEDNFVSDRIPLTTVHVDHPGVKLGTDCHTYAKLSDGEIIELEVYNVRGTLTMQVKLIVMRATLDNDLNNQSNPIVEFNAEASQMNGDDFYIDQRQDPSHLNITPYVIYADGSREIIPIDVVNGVTKTTRGKNAHCFLYGLENFHPSFPGNVQPITLKFYLNRRQQSPIVQDDGVERFLSCHKNIRVIPNDSTYGLKLSPVPIFNNSTNSWELRLFVYTERRDTVEDITRMVTITGFNGGKYYDPQNVKLSFDLQDYFGESLISRYVQNLWIKLFPPTDFMKYVYKETEESEHIFGMESVHFKRPVIHYDKDLRQYFIPTSIFPDKEAFLKEFYYQANPLVVSTDTYDPTVPTHFTLRDVTSGQVLLSAPIELDKYNKAWNVVDEDPEFILGRTVIVEFLEFLNGKYSIIHGVPVETYVSNTGYLG